MQTESEAEFVIIEDHVTCKVKIIKMSLNMLQIHDKLDKILEVLDTTLSSISFSLLTKATSESLSQEKAQSKTSDVDTQTQQTLMELNRLFLSKYGSLSFAALDKATQNLFSTRELFTIASFGVGREQSTPFDLKGRVKSITDLELATIARKMLISLTLELARTIDME
jgi:hypothetical protein